MTGLDYDVLLREGLRIVPEARFLEGWAKDDDAMRREMFYGTPMTWLEALEAVRGWEQAFNQGR